MGRGAGKKKNVLAPEAAVACSACDRQTVRGLLFLRLRVGGGVGGRTRRLFRVLRGA